ncbi:MAG TPA: L-threonylcarbamoyladenylate synthase [Fimbriimonadales bacterium]|nr:L-threonylcarbamoyladenylate synthase [Fimbriimonadales bacterium]
MIWFRPDGVNDPRLEEVARAIRDGEIVAIPTETVYGIAADAWNPHAILKIFQAKGRPEEKPISLLVADIAQARSLAREWSALAQKLAEEFWPGPLTIVVPKKENVPDIVTGGRDTVGLRVPRHPITMRLIELAQTPLAAPSANRSGEPPPDTAEDVVRQLGIAPAFVVDCGKCAIGTASSVLDLSVHPPKLLREGALKREVLEKVCEMKLS